ncbi:MAG: MotA/TolQ/ExbB proton channel family protein [Candidatus Omnitrophica bacterium]|nr:MotA/TolQ/ExbB proton channel family protein [Candidatus Omnitrophota bacterium]
MELSVFQLILQASFFVKLILVVLLVLSVASWAIIAHKYDRLHNASQESEAFLEAFVSLQDIHELHQRTQAYEASPLARLFRSGYAVRGTVRKEGLERLLRRQAAVESERLHAYLTFLATTASTAPFIGLLGTVWGIINAFRGIGAAGSASLAVVAPGIAEALITTAAGLATAIPAVMAYNYFIGWVRKLSVETEDFSDQLKDCFSGKGS